MPFEALAETLLRAGIAPRRVRRYRAELEDHLAELTKTQHAAGYEGEDAALRARALLGDDGELAAPWLADPRLKSWTARAPWAVFIALPPLAMMVVMIPPVLTLAAIAHAHRALDGTHVTPGWYRLVAMALADASNLMISPVVALLFMVLAWRQRLTAFWPLAAGLVLLLVNLHMQVGFADTHHARGSVSLGFAPAFDRRIWPMLIAQWPLTLAQSLLTLLPSAWLAQRRRVTR